MQNKKDSSPKVPQREKLNAPLKIKELPLTEKQKEFLALVEDKKTKVVFLSGPPGSSKSYITVYSALKALSEKKIGQIQLLTQPVESSKFTLGYLKGDLSEKMTPYLEVLNEKLEELLEKPDIDKLNKEERIHCSPIGFLRGRSFNASYILLEEAQNLMFQDFLLAMTRLGKYSKCLISGDPQQSDIKGSAFTKIMNLFDDEEARSNGIYVFRFEKSDIFRNESLAFILERFEKFSG